MATLLAISHRSPKSSAILRMRSLYSAQAKPLLSYIAQAYLCSARAQPQFISSLAQIQHRTRMATLLAISHRSPKSPASLNPSASSLAWYISHSNNRSVFRAPGGILSCTSR